MPLNPVKGNMYGFVTHTWNTVKGDCPHNCTYCYMGRFKNLKPRRFDSSEMKTFMEAGNTIFVGSSNDLFASLTPSQWIVDTLAKTRNSPTCKYFFQSKNPKGMLNYVDHFPTFTTLCTTLESNRNYPSIMRNSPAIESRAENIALLGQMHPTHVTIEPVMDFDMQPFVNLIRMCSPKQVNIGANTSYSKKYILPEPKPEKLIEFIARLKEYVPTVHLKPNLKRLLK